MKNVFSTRTSRSWLAFGIGPVAVLMAALLWFGSMPVSAAPAAVFAKGDVFVGVGTGKIKRYDQNGILLQTLDTTTGSSEDTGMCFDAPGNLYATIFSVNKMAKFDNSGTLLSANFGSGFNQDPESCVVDAAQNVYVGQADGTRKILKFNTAGAPLGSFTVASGGRGSDWIDLAADQCTMLYGSEGPGVKRFNVCTNTQLSDFATGLTGSCFAVRIRSNGEVMVACQSRVLRLNSAGTPVMTYTAPLSITFFFAMNLDPDGTSFWSADISNCNVVKFDIATGNILKKWNGGRLGGSCAGLAVFGELTASQPPRDLAITKSASPNPVLVGSNLTFRLVVSNTGTLPMTNVIVTDTLPANVTFVSATPSQGSCTQVAGVVRCSLGNLLGGASATTDIVVVPNVVGPLSNTATVAGNEPESNMTNNSSTVTVTVISASPPPPPAQVPEGDTLMLVGTGLAGLAGYATLRWRARRAQQRKPGSGNPS